MSGEFSEEGVLQFSLERLQELILHRFALSCARRVLALEEEAGCPLEPSYEEALRVKERWLEQSGTSEQLTRVLADIRSLLVQAEDTYEETLLQVAVEEENRSRFCWMALGVVEAALAPLAIEAAQKAASAAVCAVVMAAEGTSWVQAKDKEQQWQRERLAQLVEEHKENHAARQKELARWQEHLEDALFE